MLNALWAYFIPNKIVLFKPAEESSPEITGIAEYSTNYTSLNKRATAYICVDYQCNLPTNNIEKMLDLLDT